MAIIAVCFLSLVSSISHAQTEADIYEQAAPAVVSIQTFAGNGSGFIIGADYHIVTNAHVMDIWTTAPASGCMAALEGDYMNCDSRQDIRSSECCPA